MTAQAVAEARSKVVGASAACAPEGPHPVVLAAASAMLLWSSFLPADWSWLAWGALAPLFFLVRSARSRLSIYLGAWAGGMLFWLLSIQWVRLTDSEAWLAWLVMALALSFWWPGFLALARLAVLRLGVPLMVAAPVLWVGLEYIRAHILSGFPWYYLAHSQHRTLALIQIADFAGALGLSLLIAMVNAWLVDLRSLPLLRATASGPRLARPQVVRLCVVLGALAGTAGYGWFRIATARFHDGPKLALLQSNLEQWRKMSDRDDERNKLLAVYRGLVEKALRDNERLDLIVWPETSYPWPFVMRDPRLSDRGYERQARDLEPKVGSEFWTDWGRKIAGHLNDWTDQVRVPMLVGVLTYDFHSSGFSKFNSAVLFEPGLKAVQVYAKMHLVPFGEYIPLIKTLPWLTVLTPYHGSSYIPSLSFGREPAWFTLGRYRLAAAICFEDTIPQAVRRFFHDHRGGRDPDVLINMSNDGWFHDSSEHDMHLAVSVFRAVENRVPLARAVNTGVSALIDGNGKVLSSLPKLTEGVLSGTAPLDDRVSFYSAWGDWLGLACLALTVGTLPAGLAQPFLSRRPT